MGDIKLDLMLKVVRLYYQENMNQLQIAKKLNLSRVKVYRLILKAKNEGIVEIVINPPSVDYSELEIEIEKKYNIQQCVIVPHSENKEEIYSSFGKELVAIIERNTTKELKIGIGWGHTIEGTINSIKENKNYPLRVFPTIGGSASRFTFIHANSIVSSFVSKLGGEEYLLNCPAIMDSLKNKAIFLEESSIKKIVDHFSKLDMAIVPIGYLDEGVTIHKTGEISLNEINYLKSLGVIGDINSNFIDAQGALVANQIQDRIINVTLDDLKIIENTIAIATGQRKGQATKAALMSDAVNILLTDSKLAMTLLS